ncbi:MAG: HlyC/CorC family transporter [Chloroflexi bacterium]|nr:HlyC/CorC family transporter [Chloroflexota bacterium]
MSGLAVDVLITFILVGIDGVLAAARSAFLNARRARLQKMAEAGESGAALALKVAQDSAPLIATIRLAQTLCRFFTAGVATFFFAPPLAQLLDIWLSLEIAQTTGIAVAAVAGVAAIAVVVWVEMVPESLVLREAEAWAIRLAPLMQFLEWTFTPLVRLSVWASGMIAVPLGGRMPQIVTEEEIKTMVDAGEEGGVIEEEEKDMIYSIFQFADTLAREVMVPRIDMLALEVETPVTEAVDAVLSAGHSRIPIYAETVDNIVGVLYVKDLLRVWHEGQTRSLRELLRPAYFVPEAKPLDDLLAELQQKRVHIAIVVDEYGGTAGLVTLEDIVEEIVGEIRDEYDAAEELPYQQMGEGDYIFDGGIDIDDVNDLLESKLPNDDADTLGGYIYGQLGRVPGPGDQLATDGLMMEVQSVAGRRIRKVRVRHTPPPAKADSEAEEIES